MVSRGFAVRMVTLLDIGSAGRCSTASGEEIGGEEGGFVGRSVISS